ncbi:ATP synthase subunit D [Ascobolus immersus RN42]|uniref:ATP synthase subunit d, mitochondrial n=1 Tax=Ascobolus immersus RN42 TaxID=1160509 RepID=A0A3N4IDS3_ASCIM|nr:ATP synthase subunit D [Ascobolus immersus RN42]
MAAALKIEWAKVSSSLGLKGNTASSLSAFKKRNEDARRKLAQLQELPTTLDFSQYRGLLKNQAVIDEVESAYKAFKPTTIDVQAQLKGIEAFEAQAIKNAQDTKVQVDAQLKELAKTLENIEGARPFDQLTVEDIATARPDIDTRTAELVSRGRWSVPGYKEKFGDLSVL